MSARPAPVSDERDLRSLRLLRVGSVAPTGDALEPFHLVDAGGEVDQWVRGLVRVTCRSYLPSLLRWLRFLSAVEVSWDRAERRDVRDLVLWMRGADNPQRRRSSGVRPGSVNEVTGKPALGEGYAPATINHALSAIRMFYEYHQLSGQGPVINPVPRPARPRWCARAVASQPDRAGRAVVAGGLSPTAAKAATSFAGR